MSNLSLPIESVPPSTCRLIHGDCLEVMPTLDPGSVALCFADLPYQITACKWDLMIDLQGFWQALSPVCQSNASLLLTANMRLAAELLKTCPVPFRNDLIWQKVRASGFFHAQRTPLRIHELVLHFAGKGHTYNPQMVTVENKRRGKYNCKHSGTEVYGKSLTKSFYEYTDVRYPTSVFKAPYPDKERGLHSTQKPLSLLHWLIASFTNPGDTVLDPVMGSGVAAIACARLGRNFIGIEKDKTYFDVASKRIADERARLGLEPAEVVS